MVLLLALKLVARPTRGVGEIVLGACGVGAWRRSWFWTFIGALTKLSINATQYFIVAKVMYVAPFEVSNKLLFPSWRYHPYG